MKHFGRRSLLSPAGKRGVIAALALLVGVTFQTTPAFGGAASPGDIVIDGFTAGGGSWSACGNSTFVYTQDPSIIGGARELEMRDGGSCFFGPYPAQMAIDATQGTAKWFGNNTYSPEQVFSYGTAIGTHDYPWSPSPNKGKGTPLNLRLSLSDDILIQMQEVTSPSFGVELLDGHGNVYGAGVHLVVGANLVPLSSFPGLSAAAAEDINGISFIGSDNVPSGDVASLFAIKLGDTTPPAASPSQTPAANSNGWNNTSVTVNWNWADSGSGVDVADCTTSSIATTEGAGIKLTATCSDNAGNVASASYTVNIDETPPTVTYSGDAGTYAVDQPVSISCSATDALSGIQSDTCANISAPAWSFGLGVHSVSATATDRAGNTSSGSASFTVTVDEASLCGLVRQFSTTSGVANGLCAKLDAAAASASRGQPGTAAKILSAFDNQVEAQSGKALTADQAKVITTFAAAL